MAGLMYARAVAPGGTVYGGCVLVAFILCEGPVQRIDNFRVDGLPPDPSVVQVVAVYTGTQTYADHFLRQAIPGFNETLEGIAYFVAAFKPIEGFSLANITCEVWGLAVEDPRTGTTAWSDNPALILADVMKNRAGLAVDDEYTIAAANWCDSLVGGEKRSQATLALLDKKPVQHWIDTIRAYVPAWVVDTGDKWRIVADMPRAIDHGFGPENIDGTPAPSVQRLGLVDLPNVVDVAYTNQSADPWRTSIATVGVPSPVGDDRRTRLDLPGIRRYSQAVRFATEALNHFTLEDVTGSISVFEEGLQVLPGDIAAITEPAFGWDAKQVRVLDATDRGNGRWSITFREYDPAAYSDKVETQPSTPDTTLPSPLRCVPPSDLVLVEVLTPESNTANPGTGYIFQSRLHAAWRASPDTSIIRYELIVRRQGHVIFTAEIPSQVTEYLSSEVVQQGEVLSVEVYAVNAFRVKSESITGALTVKGKTFPPGDVPAITEAREIGGEVLLAWHAAKDIDILRYEWRYDEGNAGRGWVDMAFLDRIDALRTRFRGLPEGTHRFCVRAVDSAGLLSVNSACAVVTVTSDAGAYLNALTYTNPQLTNVIRADYPGLPSPRWVTADPALTWDAAIPSPVESETVRTVESFGVGAGTVTAWIGERQDIGMEVTGTWSVNMPARFLDAGMPEPRVGFFHSLDGATYEYAELPINGSWHGTARFVYLDFGATGKAWEIAGAPTVSVSSTIRNEYGGPVSSAAATPTRVVLSHEYTRAASITITPIGTAPCFYLIDAVTVGGGVANGFDVYIFDNTGAQVARNFLWAFTGV
jgi:hypothetical protein